MPAGTFRSVHDLPAVPMPPGVERAAYTVACPICGVHAGDPCEDIVRGLIRPEKQPHLYRIQVVQEVTR